jgi:DNA adenine methylase
MLLHRILPLLPSHFGTYFEPFLGGGALFFALQPPQSVLSDVDPGLVNCYVEVRNNPRRVIAHLRRFKNTESDYYRIRGAPPRSPAAQAARLIYLTTLSFNGIYRLNLNGEFNVPYGRKTHIDPARPDSIASASAALAAVQISCGDFQLIAEQAQPGDLVYCDPPYVVAHSRNGFLKYNSKLFSWDDQVRLAAMARQLSRAGCHVLVTNAHHPAVLDLYHGFRIQTASRASVIAASASHRGTTTECIITNF